MNDDEWKAALLEKLGLDVNRPEHMAVATACLFYCETCDGVEYAPGTAALIERIVDPEFGDGELDE